MSSDYKVIAKKEYHTLSREKPTIGLLMMVKNENKRLQVSLDSVVGPKGEKWVDAIIIFDTGSTDNTVEIIETFCEKHKINLYLIQGDFVDFSTSRNVSLDWADTVDVHYLLLLDCNDELRGGNHLKNYAKMMMDKPTTGWLVCQQWWSGKHDKYFNVRFVRNRSGWRYRGRVHEWLKDTSVEGPEPKSPLFRMPEDIVLYQDRTADDDKTKKRFRRDYKLLLQDHKDNPKEPRTVFYLAQTCQCLGKHDETFYYSKLRISLGGFEEERFHSFLRCGESVQKLGHDWENVLPWYIKAFEHSERVEPLVKIGKYYSSKNKWYMTYLFLQRAAQISYPRQCILFVDKGAYDYDRWHLLGICCYYVGDCKLGKEACLKAISEKNHERDKLNLKFYIDKDKEVKETRRQFVERVTAELEKNNPNLSAKQLTRQANNIWKKRSKS